MQRYNTNVCPVLALSMIQSSEMYVSRISFCNWNYKVFGKMSAWDIWTMSGFLGSLNISPNLSMTAVLDVDKWEPEFVALRYGWLLCSTWQSASPNDSITIWTLTCTADWYIFIRIYIFLSCSKMCLQRMQSQAKKLTYVALIWNNLFCSCQITYTGLQVEYRLPVFVD